MTKVYVPIADCRVCPVCHRVIMNLGWHPHAKAHTNRGEMTMYKELGPYGPRWVYKVLAPEATG